MTLEKAIVNNIATDQDTSFRILAVKRTSNSNTTTLSGPFKELWKGSGHDYQLWREWVVISAVLPQVVDVWMVL